MVDARLVPAVLQWFDRNGRDLPWRATREPWGILISELMSQQTQVVRVAERWPRFLLRFPTPTACADAPVGEVIDEWSGLGYNRRAVNLHRSARAMRDHHGGEVPRSLADLLALPGIGPYTARAVRVFAFETNDGVLDTNVARILARTNGRSLRPAEAQNLADVHVPQGDGWRWNQALLDLGATVCSRRPACGACPLAAACSWFAAGRPEPDPARGSAGSSGVQSTFIGSDREGRGRLVRLLRDSSIEMSMLAEAMGWPNDQKRAERVLETLLSDGLVSRDGDRLSLPG